MAAAEILPPEGALPPFAGPVVVTSDDRVILPHPHGSYSAVPLRDGLHLAWTDIAPDRIVLALFGGADADVGIAVTCSQIGLREMIADLQSIDAQLVSAD